MSQNNTERKCSLLSQSQFGIVFFFFSTCVTTQPKCKNRQETMQEVRKISNLQCVLENCQSGIILNGISQD